MKFVLGATGVSAAEMALIRTIIKLRSTLHADWTVPQSGPCDMLFWGDGTDELAPPAGATVVKLCARGVAANGLVLGRPIRAEELLAVLNDYRPSLPAPEPSQPDHQATAVRLKRWPPLSFLNGRPVYLRLSSLLTKHSLSAQQLSSLARISLGECEAFLRELAALDLLTRLESQTPHGKPIAQVQVAARRGLLSTLRRKLGIERDLT